MTDATEVTRFYGRWAGLYDLVATRLPLVDGWRRDAVESLDLDAGDTVVEMGVGTGANLALLRDQVGPSGRVVGLDLTPGVLSRARHRVRTSGWQNVELLRADAARPPFEGPVDAVLGTFVVGMLASPAEVVRGWLELLDPAGRLALLDAAPSDDRRATPLSPLFRAFVTLSTPPTGRLRYDESPAERLGCRVETAHGAIESYAGDVRVVRRLFGFVRLTAGGSGEPLS